MRRAWVRVTAPELMCLLEAVGERALRGALDAIEVSGELLRIEDEAPGLRPSDDAGADLPDFGELARATLDDHEGTLTAGQLAHELALAYEAGQQNARGVRTSERHNCHAHNKPDCDFCLPRVGGVRPPDPEPAPLELVAQLAKDIITAVESHDTHRMQHIEQYARRIVRVAGGT